MRSGPKNLIPAWARPRATADRTLDVRARYHGLPLLDILEETGRVGGLRFQVSGGDDRDRPGLRPSGLDPLREAPPVVADQRPRRIHHERGQR